MSIFDRFKKKKEEENLEVERRDNLLRGGRITEGKIIDAETTEAGEVAYYAYSIHGAEYESSEILSEEQLREPLKYAPGAKVGIRYDPRNHGNSMLD